jgi:TRAP transporter TAXI family solute receptor
MLDAAILASASLLLAGQSVARAEPPDQPTKTVQEVAPHVARQVVWGAQRAASRLKHNQETLIVAASRPDTPYLAMAGDLASAVAADAGVRILPIAAEGGLTNLQDLLLLRGVDLAIVPANVLAHAKATNALGGGLLQRLAYVAPLYGEEVHVVVGPEIASVADLHGKKVAIPPGDGTVQFTAKDVFQRLGVAVEEVRMAAADAVREVRAGTIAATLLVAGKPVSLVSTLPKDGRLRLLSLSFRTPPGEAEGYSPAVLLPEDYPALIPPGAMVETVAVSAVLMANKETDEAARRVARHAPVLLDAIARLAVSQRHPKWKDVNLGAVLPGWSRVPAVEAWLAHASAQRREALQSQFADFLQAERQVQSSKISDPQKKKLFDEFQAWARNSVTSERAAK